MGESGIFHNILIYRSYVNHAQLRHVTGEPNPSSTPHMTHQFFVLTFINFIVS